MSLEQIAYKKNIDSFAEKTINKYIDKLIISLDLKPDFDTALIPFHFDYAINVIFSFESSEVILHTSMTSTAIDTFWFCNKFDKLLGVNKEIQIDAELLSLKFESKNGFDYPYKMTSTFSDKTLFIYCGEIYRAENSNLTYKIYDEMLLLFDNEIDAMNFEKNINYG
jgi:hypothetical protein